MSILISQHDNQPECYSIEGGANNSWTFSATTGKVNTEKPSSLEFLWLSPGTSRIAK